MHLDFEETRRRPRNVPEEDYWKYELELPIQIEDGTRYPAPKESLSDIKILDIKLNLPRNIQDQLQWPDQPHISSYAYILLIFL